MAVDVFIPAVGVMKSATPLSGHAYIVADRNYPIAPMDIIVGLVSLEVKFCKVFCDGLPTVKCPVHRHLHRIVRVPCSESISFRGFVVVSRASRYHSLHLILADLEIQGVEDLR
jgi:hypothetical protein